MSLPIVATCSTPLEADLIKNRLEQEGVRAFLSDDATVGWLWHLGTALHGIKVHVAEEDLPRAMAILERRQSEGGSHPEAEETAEPISEEGCAPEDDATAEHDTDEPEESTTGDRLAERALRAALLGFLMCPPLLHVYSLFVLLQLTSYEGEMSQAGIRKAYVALVIDLLVVSGLLLMWLLLVFGFCMIH